MSFETNPFRQRILPNVVKNLLIINGLAYLLTLYFEKQGTDLVELGGLHYFQSPLFKSYQLVTYMFLHGGFWHIFLNMFALWMFGTAVENEWGPKRFLTYYFVCGIGAAILQNVAWYYTLKPHLDALGDPQLSLQHGMDAVIEARNSWLNAPVAVGASGAVFGILLAYGMTFPNNLLFIIPIPFPIKAKYAVLIYGVFELTQGVGVVKLPGDNIAHFAHLGGLLFGFLLIMYWRWQNNRNRFNQY